MPILRSPNPDSRSDYYTYYTYHTYYTYYTYYTYKVKRGEIFDEYFGSLTEMKALREKVEDALLVRFGQWDSTNDLVKNAIEILSRRCMP